MSVNEADGDYLYHKLHFIENYSIKIVTPFFKSRVCFG